MIKPISIVSVKMPRSLASQIRKAIPKSEITTPTVTGTLLMDDQFFTAFTSFVRVPGGGGTGCLRRGRRVAGSRGGWSRGPGCLPTPR